MDKKMGPWVLAAWLGATSLVVAGTALATPSAATGGTTAAANTDGKVLGIAFVGRMVADLDKSIPFYEAIGLTRDPSVDSSWRRDEALNRLFGIKGAQFRTARMTIDSNISGKPFAIYLHELRGIKRITVGGYMPWEPGASHFGIVVPDAQLVWSQLKARGMLHARSWGGELIPFPGQTKGALAYLTDPDGLDIELINQRPATPARAGQPARQAIPPGLSHAGLVILDSDKAKAFYGNLLGGQLVETNSPWLQGDFYDSAVGGHGNILRFFNESFPEAADPRAFMHFELVEFQNRKKPVAAYHISDITVGYVGFEVEGIDALLARAKGAGASVVSKGGVVKLDDKSRAVLVRDPDVGGFIELFEPAGRER
jgi:catechol 2,3-dioxygenase-like lactoylglutathione lyase family enzyme